MIMADGDEEWILKPAFRRGEDLYEQTDNEVNIRKKVVLDNEDYRVYVPLDEKSLCNITIVELQSNFSQKVMYNTSMLKWWS